MFCKQLTDATGAPVGMEERKDTWGTSTEMPEINDVIFELLPSARIFDRYDAVKFVDDNAVVKFVADGATEALA